MNRSQENEGEPWWYKEERQIIEMLNTLRREYERQAKLYFDRLKEIERLKPGDSNE